MANAIFANGREIACKAAAGKTICAMPDVCFTPPENPATPPGIPIPYPNTGMASDTTDGSKKVKISKKEVGLKNKSSFKKSMGDEAGAAAKKGVITSKNTGKVFFESWSMDVKIEGQNAVRHLDMTTNNHASTPGDTPPWPYMDSMKIGSGDPCEKDKDKEKEACKDYKPDGNEDPCPTEVLGVSPGTLTQKRIHKPHYEELAKKAKQNECLKARKCKLTPYDAEKNGVDGCCPGQTGDHVIDDANFKGMQEYSKAKAPCVCASGPNNTWASHGEMHTIKGHFVKMYKRKHKVSSVPYKILRKMSATALTIVFKSSGCERVCIEAQLDAYFKNSKKPIVKNDTVLAGKASGRSGEKAGKNKLIELLG